MQSQTSDNSGFNKLKSIIFLGLNCNRTTIIGCILTWMFLQQKEWLYDWKGIFLTVICVAPFFMGDAVNNYVLGRIRLEYQNDWDDIRITEQIKKRIFTYYKFYRALSIISAYGIVYWILMIISKISYPDWLIPTLLSVVCLHFILSLLTIIKGIAPVIPQYKKQGLIYRGVFIILSSVIWYFIFKNQAIDKINNLFIFMSGMLYFVVCGMMHPLPAKGSLFESILRETILSQAKAAAKAKAAQGNQSINYNINNHDIEDAAILDSKIENPENSTEILKDSESEAIMPDGIIIQSNSDNFIDSVESKKEEIEEISPSPISKEETNN